MINNRKNKNFETSLRNTLRQLWEQHVMWTRSFIISTAEGLGDLDLVTTRLLKNPQDMADALRPFYGDQVAKKFQMLLTEHLSIAGELVNAAKAGEQGKADALRKKWYQNADDISAFMSSLNPYWSKENWQKMLYEHLQMTEAEATNRIGKNYEKDIALYDQIEDGALKMADYMAVGLIKQFGL